MPDLANISRLIEQGKVPEARAALANFPRGDIEANRLRLIVRNLILRKSQRQAKVAEFLAEAGSDVRLRVAAARLAGTLPQLATASPPESFEALLAVLAGGDLRAGLARLRRVPGYAELAQGWMAMLRGDLSQASASFASVPAAERRRAACGHAVVAALSGQAADVEQHLAGLGPFPHTAFPAIAGMLHQVTRQRNEHGPAKLAEHLRCTTSGSLQRAYDGWPKAQTESKAWLALHLGDVRWAEAGAQGDQRAVTLWHEAARLHPSLQADVLKRLLLAFTTLRVPVPGTWRLHRDLHQRNATLARQVVDSVTAEWPAPWCVQHLDTLHSELGQIAPETLPVEMQLLRFRALTALPAWEREQANSDLKLLRPVLDQCDAAYAGNLTWTRIKLDILGLVGHYGERRKTCFAALMAEPSCAPEILPLYLAAARRELRAKRQVSDEFAQLSSVLGDDVDLAVLGVETGNLAVATVQARWAGPMATAILVVANKGKANDLSTLGQDEALDILACMASGHLKKSQLDRLLIDRERLHRLLRRHQRRLAMRFNATDELFGRWQKKDPRDWRPWFHIGAFARLRNDHQMTSRAWNRALSRIPREAPEHAEMASWLNHNDDSGHFGFDDDFDSEDDAESGPSFAEFEKRLKELLRQQSPTGDTSPSGDAGSPSKKKKSTLLPQPETPAKTRIVSDPLLLPAAAYESFRATHGAAMSMRMLVLIPSLGIPTTRDAAGLAERILPVERAAVRDWLSLLTQHNNRMHDLSIASAIAVMITRLNHLVSGS
jgi:hypothetical protein